MSELLHALHDSTEKFIALLESFPEESWMNKPDENTWSAAEVAGHVSLLDLYIARMMQQKGIKADRDPMQQKELIKKALEDHTRKLTAPEPIQVKDANDKQSSVNNFLKYRRMIAESISTQDLDEICPGFKHAYFGYLSRGEWAWFTVYHSNRHMMQIKKLQSLPSI